MGDRANILVKESTEDSGVYLYTHGEGSILPEKLHKALAKKVRWNDCQYLTRIIFDVMTENNHGEETGYGISAFLGDGSDRVLVVDCDNQTVSYKGFKIWSFQEFSELSKEDLLSVWKIN